MAKDIKNKQKQSISVSAPGRICLFGEHLDYMKLPVIACAINLRIKIYGTPRNDKKFNINIPDINAYETFEATNLIPYTKKRDYWRSVVNVIQKKGVNIEHGFDCEVHGEIPIAGGCSSSSALVVGWTKFLLTAFNDQRANDAKEIASLSYEAEVAEFNEPTGWMDQFSSALGGIYYFDCGIAPPIIKKLPAKLGKFVIGDSLQPKDTIGILKRLKGSRFNIIKKLEPNLKLEDLRTISEKEINQFSKRLSEEEELLLKATIRNRDYVREGLKLLSKEEVSSQEFGHFLDKQQALLRDVFKVSTDTIEQMLKIAKSKRASGGKVNGSGGGGCMFVYAPDTFMDVVDAFLSMGKKAYISQPAPGVTFHPEETV